MRRISDAFTSACTMWMPNLMNLISFILLRSGTIIFIRPILEFHVCSFDVHAMCALEVFNFQQWNYVHATAVWTTSCRVSTQYRLNWNPLNVSTDLVIIYNSYISFLVYTVLEYNLSFVDAVMFSTCPSLKRGKALVSRL